jgi:hypothetical protein
MNLALIAEAAHNTIPGEPWMYGVAAFVGLTALLYALTRLNPFR